MNTEISGIQLGEAAVRGEVEHGAVRRHVHPSRLRLLPGIHGIGPSKAYELIRKHKTVENVLEKLDRKVRTKRPVLGLHSSVETRVLVTGP